MNEDTRVAICCYAGDQHQVIHCLGTYLHHECPVVVLSPENSKVEINYPGIENRFGGEREYVGQKSIDRQRKHLEILLTFPEKFFFINDADSVCLSPKLPDYLYAEPNTVWSNLCAHDSRAELYPAGVPQIAFWPPYFLSRDTIKAMLAVADNYRVDPAFRLTKNIDYYMVQLTRMAGLPWRGYPTELIYSHQAIHGDAAVFDAVRNHGVVFIHSVKEAKILHTLVELHKLYAKEHP